MRRTWRLQLLVLVMLLALAVPASGKHFISDEEFKGGSNFQFLTKFCFEQTGRLQFELTYPKVQCCARLLFYYNNPSQWAKVKKESGQSCVDRELVAVQAGNYLTLSKNAYDGCAEIDVGGVTFIQCRGDIHFRSTWHEWWFFVISSCGQNAVTLLNYNFTMHNSPGLFTLEFSADEFGILETDIAFLILYFFLLGQSIAVAKVLRFRRLLHPSYLIFMASIFISFMTLAFHTGHYGLYSRDGIGVPKLKNVGDFLQFLQFSLFLFLLLLLAKGWTITRAKLRDKSIYRLILFFFMYFIVAMVMYIWFQSADIESEVLYIYASPPGYGLVGVYFIVFFWFCYAIAFSVKNCESRQFFFKVFFVVFAPWFLLTPCSILILAQVVEDYNRQKIVNGITWGITAYGHLVFAVMTFPAHFSQFFPYHIRTTQIDILNDTEDPAGAYAAAPSDQVATSCDEVTVNNIMPARAKRRSLQTKLFVQESVDPEFEAMTGGDDASDSGIHLDRPKGSGGSGGGGQSVDLATGDRDDPDLGLDGDLGNGLRDDSDSSRRNLLQHTGMWVTETGLADPAVVATSRSGKWARSETTETYLEESGPHIEMHFLPPAAGAPRAGDVASVVTASSSASSPSPSKPRSGRSSSSKSRTSGSYTVGSATVLGGSTRATLSATRRSEEQESEVFANPSALNALSRATPTASSSSVKLTEESVPMDDGAAGSSVKRQAWGSKSSAVPPQYAVMAALVAGDDSALGVSASANAVAVGSKKFRKQKKRSATKQTATDTTAAAKRSPQRGSIFSPQ